jgi:thioesterase domain-containing protein/NAD(P)-dependent dehydrogenase (short-subunit alcohol dehydrogenase family)/acyl carrier protein
MMEPVLQPFTQRVSQVKLQPPKIPFVSNVTGTWITTAEAMDPSYWARHVRQTVRFAEGVAELVKEPDVILLEVGPGQTLGTLAKQHPNRGKGQVVLSSLRHPYDDQSDVVFLLNALGQLWLSGVQVDWSGFYANERRRRLPLPAYPFERQRYWIDPQKQVDDGRLQYGLSRKKADIADWFYVPSWKRSAPQIPPESGDLTDQTLSRTIGEGTSWLLFVDIGGLGEQITKRLRQAGQDVIVVRVGDQFAQLGNQEFTINPRKLEDYVALFRSLHTQDKTPNKIMHLWGVGLNNKTLTKMVCLEKAQDLGFYSLLFLVQALGNQHKLASIQIAVVTTNVQEVTGEEILYPERSTVLGPCKVIPQEYPNITCRSIDLVVPKPGIWEATTVDQLITELISESSESIVAYRGSHRWVQTFEPLQLEKKNERPTSLREQGVYLITGGLGGIGLVLAEYLAKTVQAKLVLIGRSGLPSRDEWGHWLAVHSEQDHTSRKIQRIQTMEELGAEVLVATADVAHRGQMQALINQVYQRFGQIHGVIHAAGVTEENSFHAISEVTKAECKRHFQPKVQGLFILEDVLEGRSLDFCLLFSSLSSVLGGLRFVAYSAANLFIDAFAHKHNQKNVGPWLSVNWDGWQFREENKRNTLIGTTVANFAIKPNEGVEIFQRILSMGPATQIVVSTGDLQTRIDQWIKLESLRDSEETKSVDVPLLYPRPDLDNTYVAPQNEIEQAVAAIWQTLFGIEQVGVHDNFFELGGHSLLAVRMFAQIEETLGRNLPVGLIFQAPTVEQLASILRREGWSPPQTSLVPMQTDGPKRPLFFVPPAGNTVVGFADLIRNLGTDQPCYGLQPPTPNGRQTPFNRVEDLATHFIKEIRTIQPEGPYLLGGQCFGGQVVFEMAQQLRTQGQETALLALFDTPYPNPTLSSKISWHLEVLGQLESKEKLDYVLIKVKRRLAKMISRVYLKTGRPLPAQVQTLTTEAGIRQASNAYQPQRYQGQITLFRAEDEGFGEGSQNLERGWGYVAAAGVEVHLVPGTHDEMMSEPHVQELAEQLRVCLDQIQATDEELRNDSI